MSDHERADPVLEEIWEIRRRLSAEIGNDPEAIAAYLIRFQEQFRDRLLPSPAKREGTGKSAA